jgi:hypothetical protein
MAVKRYKKSKVSAPVLGATVAAAGLLSMIGSASAADGSASHTAPVSQIVLSDESDVTLAGWYDGYYYSPAPSCGFWGKGCGAGGGHRHHHRGNRGV